MSRLERQDKSYRPRPVLRLGVHSSSIPVQLSVVIVIEKNRRNRRCRVAWFRLEGELIHGQLASYGCITSVDAQCTDTISYWSARRLASQSLTSIVRILWALNDNPDLRPRRASRSETLLGLLHTRCNSLAEGLAPLLAALGCALGGNLDGGDKRSLVPEHTRFERLVRFGAGRGPEGADLERGSGAAEVGGGERRWENGQDVCGWC